MKAAPESIALPKEALKMYTVIQQEVAIGARALEQKNPEMAIAMFQSALQKVRIDQPFHDHLVHNLLLAYTLLIRQMLAQENNAGARRILDRVLELDVLGSMARDPGFRERFALVLHELCLSFLERGQPDASVLCGRKAISVFAGPGYHLNLSVPLRRTAQAALLSDFAPELKPDELGRHMFITSVPKSASTFLKNVLVELSGYRDTFMVTSTWQFEQELYLPTLRHVASLDTVTQQHTRASDVNVQIMQAFGIRPIVLIRNIFDAVVSLLDFYNAGAFTVSFFQEGYSLLDDATKLDLIIDNFVPWYFLFVSSWDQVERQARLELTWLTYDELTTNTHDSVARMLAFYGLAANVRDIARVIKQVQSEKRRSRFNKGVAGRGATLLSTAQKQRISSFARYYPTTDFGRLGL
jgi:hypothetical protein